MSKQDTPLYTIPQLAKRLGITPVSVRDFLRNGHVKEPQEHPVTGERFYTAEDADVIEQWYMDRCANGGTRGPGANARRARAIEYRKARQNGGKGETAKPAPVRKDTPADLISKEVSRWLELPNDLLPVVALVVAVANRLPGPPVWLMIVAPPSSGKSEVIMGIALLEGVHKLYKLTAQTFVSGMKRSSSASAPSLLQRLQEQGKWLITLKDFGTLQSLNPTARNEILGQLREIFDGQFGGSYGTGEDPDWDGKLGLLVGATPAVDSQHKWSAELGERFVQFRPEAADPSEVADKAEAVTEKQDELRRTIAVAYQQAFEEAMRLIASVGSVAITDRSRHAAKKLALFVADARRVVKRDSRSYSSAYQVLPQEGPGRLVKTFRQLLAGALVCYGGDKDAAIQLVTRIAVDSVPGRRGRLLRELAISRDGVIVADMALLLECDPGTARRELDDLVAIKLAVKQKPLQTEIYKASETLGKHACKIVQMEDSAEALRKLFDR